MSLIQPTRITAEDFKAYSTAWKKLVNGPDANSLHDYFTGDGGLINYVYLPAAMATELLAGRPTSIALEFALIPGTATPTFSMMLAGLNSNNQPVVPYYQAGVAGRAKVVVQPTELMQPKSTDIPIPYEDAAAWINAWNALLPDGLGPQQFESGYNERLWAYDYSVSDLQDALHSAAPANPALWFNFMLHNATPLFGTVLTLNSLPGDTDPGTIILRESLSYYDVSKPCPPFHLAEPAL